MSRSLYQHPLAYVLGLEGLALPIKTHEAYERWATFYDEPGNELIDIEGPIVREILAGLPVGIAVDAGRF